MSRPVFSYVFSVKGVIFEQPEAPWRAATYAMQDAVKLVAEKLKSNLSGGLVRIGPGRYGHIAPQIQAETRQAGDDQVLGRVHAVGKAAFRAPILERGAVAHFIGPKRGAAIRFLEHGV